MRWCKYGKLLAFRNANQHILFDSWCQLYTQGQREDKIGLVLLSLTRRQEYVVEACQWSLFIAL